MVASAPARGETAWPNRCLAPQLGPSWTSSERTFEQSVSPSPRGDRSDRPCTPRKSHETTIYLLEKGNQRHLGGTFVRRVLARVKRTSRRDTRQRLVT